MNPRACILFGSRVFQRRSSVELLHQPEDIIAERYRIVNILGRGGIGITYQAEDLHNGERVALKELSLRQMADWKVLELFEREARVLSYLNHPAIPRYLDHFQVDTANNRYFYLVQALAEGQPLATLVQGGWHASEGEVRRLAMQVLEILSYIHSLKPPIIHRDIKPQNLILRQDGQLFLVDFGSVQDTYRGTLTQGSTVVGTYGYMAPEQFRGQAVPATDLYGLGATLLFLLTHRSPADLPQRRLRIDFRFHLTLSPDFADWLETMLEPAMEDRFPSAKQALAALPGSNELTQKSPSLNQPLRTPRDNPSTWSERFEQVCAKGELLVTSSEVPRLHQPAESHIALSNTGKRLVVDIPPPGLVPGNELFVLCTLFWNVFVFFLTASTITTGTPLWILLSLIPFWLTGLGLIEALLFRVAGRIRLEIDRQNFRLQWRLLGMKYQVQGRTEEIARVELSSVYELNHRPVLTCTLVEGFRQHRFGLLLTQLEKAWLVAEVGAFLVMVRLQMHR